VTTAAQFQAGGDGPATIASTATLTLAAGSATVTEVTVELANVKDVGFEELTVDPGSVSLSLGIAQPRSETLIVKGIADVGVFQTFFAKREVHQQLGYADGWRQDHSAESIHQ
jgi:hypothetical protein